MSLLHHYVNKYESSNYVWGKKFMISIVNKKHLINSHPL